jgi:hypothetical protein
MGSSLQRLEILLIGLVILLAGAVAAVLTLVRPASPAIDGRTSPPAISVTILPTAVAAPSPDVAPTMATSVPVTLAVPRVASPSLTAGVVLPSALKAAWPWLLMTAALVGTGLVTLRFKRRRMTYVGQSVGQLLGAADTTTRTSNIRVMRELADKGLLTAELAAAAGIPFSRGWRRGVRLPSIHLPRLRWPRITFLALCISRLRAPGWTRLRRRLLALWHENVRTRRSPAAAPAVLTGIAPLPPEPVTVHVVESIGAATEQAEPIPSIVVAGDTAQEIWTADDRTQVVAAALAAIWEQGGLRSSVLAVDTETRDGPGQVAVLVDAAAADEAVLAELPQRVASRAASWHADWRDGALIVDVPAPVASSPAGPLLVALLTYGRGGRTTRYVPLTWGGSHTTPTHHLGVYGAQALGALHAALGSLLYAHPPTALALAILDHGEIAPLYRAAPHRVDLPTDGAAVDALARAVRQIPRRTDVRPLLLVVVEPDASVLLALNALLLRLRQQPHAPLHLLIVQERLRPEGRELYAVLPALITAGGQGPANWLPGQNDWPRGAGARLVGHGVQVEGRALTLDEAAIAAMITGLGTVAGQFPPVLWDALPTAVVDEPAAAHAGISLSEAAEAVAAVAIEPGIDVGAETSAHPSALQALSLDTAGLEHNARKARLAAALAGQAGVTQNRQDTTAPAPRAVLASNQLTIDAYPIATGWPHGPLGLTPSALAVLLAHIVSDTAFTTAPQLDQVGVTKRRLQSAGLKLALFPEPQARPLAEALMVWFDAAGVLADPAHPHDHRLNQPRALATSDLARIAERLRATPPPTPEAVRAAFASSVGGAP